jgi:hypothetical protein
MYFYFTFIKYDMFRDIVDHGQICGLQPWHARGMVSPPRFGQAQGREIGRSSARNSPPGRCGATGGQWSG